MYLHNARFECGPVCECLAFVPSPLDPLLLQAHRLFRWRMPRPCSVLLSGFRVVLGFLVWGLGAFGFCFCVPACQWQPVCQCLVVLPSSLSPFLVSLFTLHVLFVCPGWKFVVAAARSSSASCLGQTLGPGAGAVLGSVEVGSGFVLGLC